jgi:hypothetical protein
MTGRLAGRLRSEMCVERDWKMKELLLEVEELKRTKFDWNDFPSKSCNR